MAAPVALKVDCPVCGGLIGWNDLSGPGIRTGESVTFTLRFVLDDLSKRRHRACGITPAGEPHDMA